MAFGFLKDFINMLRFNKHGLAEGAKGANAASLRAKLALRNFDALRSKHLNPFFRLLAF
ncbi:hypothetical protein [Pseudovibrio sp. Ad5]|uniref:hypothetical protein n=1 Tax=Pseudovibrio sp. Ad5 TaxID=989436 RepID=UPI00187D459C|nr:hypothetical protein [Pseudovibrio sp. Ad5]